MIAHIIIRTPPFFLAGALELPWTIYNSTYSICNFLDYERFSDNKKEPNLALCFLEKLIE